MVIGQRHDLDSHQLQRPEAKLRGESYSSPGDPLALARLAHPVTHRRTAMGAIALIQPNAAQQPPGSLLDDGEGEMLLRQPALAAVLDPRPCLGEVVAGMAPGQPASDRGERFAHRFVQLRRILCAPRAQPEHVIGQFQVDRDRHAGSVCVRSMRPG